MTAVEHERRRPCRLGLWEAIEPFRERTDLSDLDVGRRVGEPRTVGRELCAAARCGPAQSEPGSGFR